MTDLELARAAVQGDRDALATCRQLVADEVRLAAKKTTASATQVADVTADLDRLLFAERALADYTGRGALQAYFRITATRALFRVVNRARREVQVDDDLLERLAPDHDPELSYLRSQYREVVDAAMRAAVTALDDHARALLRYQIVLGHSVEQVGKLYGVHKATAARWTATARDSLAAHLRAELARALGVTEIDSIVRLVQSRVDISLERVLR